jgi:hypothetical protein
MGASWASLVQKARLNIKSKTIHLIIVDVLISICSLLFVFFPVFQSWSMGRTGFHKFSRLPGGRSLAGISNKKLKKNQNPLNSREICYRISLLKTGRSENEKGYDPGITWQSE